MAFRFPLEAVLKLRRAQERRELLRLVVLANELSQLQQQEETLAEQKRSLHGMTENALREGTSAAELHFLGAAASAAKVRQQALHERRAAVEHQRQTQQNLFQQAQKNRKILENLRTRDLDAFHHEQDRREQQQIDELFVLRPQKTR